MLPPSTQPDLVLWLCWTVTGIVGSLLYWATWGWIYDLGHGDAGPDIYLTVGGLTALGQWIVLRVRAGLPAWSWWLWVGGGAISGFVPAFAFVDYGTAGEASLLLVWGLILGFIGGLVQWTGLFELGPWLRWAPFWSVVSALGCSAGWVSNFVGSLLWPALHLDFFGYAITAALTGLVTMWVKRADIH